LLSPFRIVFTADAGGLERLHVLVRIKLQNSKGPV
jgi:hypothetical protein